MEANLQTTVLRAEPREVSERQLYRMLWRVIETYVTGRIALFGGVATPQ